MTGTKKQKGTPDISVIVAVYNKPEFLEWVLTSLTNQSFESFEVIVADDGSGPEITAVIDAYQGRFLYPIVHVWHEDDGFRKTIVVNRAVTKASAGYLVFIDGDCILHKRFLKRHYRRRKPGQVLTGRRVMLDEQVTARITLDDVSSRKVERVSYWLGHCGRNDCRHGFYVPLMSVLRNRFRANFEIVGSNFSVHKKDFYRINGYDERIVGRGLEDNNLCTRFINAGISVKSVVYEALQYHCFHTAKAPPHSEAFMDEFRNSAETRTPYGIVKD